MGTPCLVTVKPDGEVVIWLVGANLDTIHIVGQDCATRYPEHITFIGIAEEE